MLSCSTGSVVAKPDSSKYMDRIHNGFSWVPDTNIHLSFTASPFRTDPQPVQFRARHEIISQLIILFLSTENTLSPFSCGAQSDKANLLLRASHTGALATHGRGYEFHSILKPQRRKVSMKVKRLFLSVVWGALILSLAIIPSMAADPLVVWCEPQKMGTIEPLADQWSKKTGIPVKVEPVGVLETANKVQLAGPMGKGPDVFCSVSGSLGMLVVTGTVAPVNPKTFDLSNFMKVSVDAATFNGKLYGVPYDISTVAMIYNKKIWPEPPKTFNEMIDRSRELRKKGKFGILWPMESFYFSYAIMAGYGGYIFAPTESGWDTKDIGLANPGSVKAVKLLKTLRDEGIIPVGTDHVVAPARFSEGNAAAIIDGSWALPGIKQAGIDYGVAPLPKLDNDKYPAPFVSLKWWHISSYSQRKTDAANLISYLTTKEAMYKSFKAAEGIPPRLDVLQMPDVKSMPEVAGYGAQANYGSILPDIPEVNPVWAPMDSALEIAIRGDKSVEAALSDAVKIIRQNIAELK